MGAWGVVKSAYRDTIVAINGAPLAVRMTKTRVAEDLAIARKRPLWSQIKWTSVQQREFDDYWLDVYGRKIPNWWHKLYQRSSGSFAVDYIPEKLFTTVIEPHYNDFSYAQVLEDKTLVEIMARGLSCEVPKTIVLRVAGTYYDRYRCPIDRNTAAELLATAGRTVLKPTYGSSSGDGIVFWQAQDYGDPMLEAKCLFKTICGDFLAQEVIAQHHQFSAFNSSSINTVRITTYVADGIVRHVPLAFRIGRDGKRVDNIHAGGVGVGIQDDGSLLSRAYDLGFGDKVVTLEKHPDSGVTFAGAKLPGIKGILDAASKMHGRYTRVGIISWDFAVSEEGKPVLIEANTLGQGIWFPQMIHGKGAFGEQTKAVLSAVRAR